MSTGTLIKYTGRYSKLNNIQTCFIQICTCINQRELDKVNKLYVTINAELLIEGSICENTKDGKYSIASY